jgi:hypothetical protein
MLQIYELACLLGFLFLSFSLSSGNVNMLEIKWKKCPTLHNYIAFSFEHFRILYMSLSLSLFEFSSWWFWENPEIKGVKERSKVREI